MGKNHSGRDSDRFAIEVIDSRSMDHSFRAPVYADGIPLSVGPDEAMDCVVALDF